MAIDRRTFLSHSAGMAALLATGASLSSRSRAASRVADSLSPPDPLILTLNRTTFGITADLLAQASQLGREEWLEQQLDPESIDDSGVEAVLSQQMPTLYLSPRELARWPEPQQVPAQLKQATLYRALYSRRQLLEVMVEFWSNHFSIYHLDGPLRLLKTIDDREVNRPHALGSFRDLLHASSKSPAMLVYLDNHTNVAGTPNENYARELMELHTLGVDGGYTEQDVQEVARCLTGWAVGRYGTDEVGQFRFYPRRHDDGKKQVLGTRIPANGGIRDGETVVDLLAGHPATARFIATKLVRRFVSDEPPANLVQRVAATFEETDGDIRSLLRVILFSDEFLASADQKLKRPVEFMASALRVTGLAPNRRIYALLRQALNAMGQVPFNWIPPDGYPDVATYWASTNGLLNRWNFTSALVATGRDRSGINYREFIGRQTDPDSVVDALAVRLLHRPLTAQDHKLFSRFLSDGADNTRALSQEQLATAVPSLIGLMLSSDYFQYR